MIDIGVNLLHAQFAGDRDQVVARAWQAGIEQMIVTGTDVATSRAAGELVSRDDAGRLSATAGIHPHHADGAGSGWRGDLVELAGKPGIVAIGETGLDFNRNFSSPAAQQSLFREQLALAAELALPVFVHDRDAGDSVAGCLREAADISAGVVVHCFTGTAEDLERYLDLGCHIGITGWVCDHRRGGPLRALVPRIPMERLMIETDAPFLRPHNAPADAHGRRNEPALLHWVARQLADLYGTDLDRVTEVTADNARRLFRLPAVPRPA